VRCGFAVRYQLTGVSIPVAAGMVASVRANRCSKLGTFPLAEGIQTPPSVNAACCAPIYPRARQEKLAREEGGQPEVTNGSFSGFLGHPARTSTRRRFYLSAEGRREGLDSGWGVRISRLPPRSRPSKVPKKRGANVAETQISAYISESTKEQVERYVEAHGITRGYLLEQALLHHLQALRELPADLVIPPRLSVTAKSFETLAGLVKTPRRRTRALRDLMAGKIVDGEP